MANTAPSMQQVAQGLGWFSVGLGVSELVAPSWFTRVLGLQGKEWLIQAYGARELVSGIGILSSDRRSPWVWSRVIGDAMDLATLASASRKQNAEKAMALVIGVTVLDLACATEETERETAK